MYKKNIYIYSKKYVVVAQSCPTLCDSMDYSLPVHVAFVHGILQAKILEWVAMPSSRGSSWPGDQTQVSCIAGRSFAALAIREAHTYISMLLQIQRNSRWKIHFIDNGFGWRITFPSPAMLEKQPRCSSSLAWLFSYSTLKNWLWK